MIASLIALPYGLAMASLMGLPPVLGVYTSIITGPFCALLGRNPVLIGGTSSVTVPFIAAAVRAQGISGAAKVCVCASILMMAFCILRLGRHVARVPHSVVAGFSCGIGGMMIISQLKTVLALPRPAGGWHESMLLQLLQVLEDVAHFHVPPLVVAMTVVVIATLVIYRLPRSPAPLFGVAVALVVSKFFGWNGEEVGKLFSGLPLPIGFRWESSDVWNVLPAALGLALVSSVDLLMTSRVVEHFRGRHRLMKKHDADMELGAYGIGNLVGGIFGAPTSVGIPARSLANVQCGASTAISNLVHAILLTGLLVFGTQILAQVPRAALAGVTVWMGARLLDWSTWRRLGRMRRVDAAAFAGTAVSVLLVNAVAAISIGCSIHVLHHVYRRFWLKRSAVLRAARTASTETGQGS